MSNIGSLDLQTAIVAALKNDATVAAIVSDRVYDSVPQGALFPYIVVGEGVEEDSDYFGEVGHAIRARVECWTQDGESTTAGTGAAGYKVGFQMADAVKAVLFGTSFESSISGSDVIVLRCDSVERKRFLDQPPYLRVVAPSFIVLVEDS
jgi:hypothetical protein